MRALFATLLFAACDARALDLPIDGGAFDFAHVHDDMAHHHRDMLGPEQPDLSVPPDLSVMPGSDMANDGCEHFATWPNNAPFAHEQADTFDDGFDYIVTVYDTSQGLSFGYEYWHPTGTPDPAYPRTKIVTSADDYTNCADCVVAYNGTPPSLGSATTFYLAQSGTVIITAADHNGSHGNVGVSGVNMHLVEWSYSPGASDNAVPGGTCIDVDSFSLAGEWKH